MLYVFSLWGTCFSFTSTPGMNSTSSTPGMNSTRCLEAGSSVGRGASSCVCSLSQTLVVCYGTLVHVYSNEKMHSVVAIVNNHVSYGRFTEKICGWRSGFDREFDRLVPTTSSWRYFSTINWFNHVSVYIGSLEMAWWSNDSTGLVCFWLIFNVRQNGLEMEQPPNSSIE